MIEKQYLCIGLLFNRKDAFSFLFKLTERQELWYVM